MSRLLRYSLVLLSAIPVWSADTITAGHPRLWLTSAMITNIHAHVLANDSVWTTFAGYADTAYSSTAVYELMMQAGMYVALHNIPGDVTDGAAYDPAGHTSAQFATNAITNYMGYVSFGTSTYCPSGTLAGCLAASPMVSPMQGNEPKNNGQQVALTYDWLQYGTNQWGSNQTVANQFLQAVSGGLQAGTNGDPTECGPGAGAIAPDDNECVGNMMSQALAAMAIFGDSLNACDNENRFLSPTTGTNCQFDWIMNDSTYGYRAFFQPYVNTGIGVGVTKAEGASYGYGDFAMTIRSLFGIATGSNANFFASVSNWLNETTTWMFHATTPQSDGINGSVTSGPNFFYMLQFGDQSGFYSLNEEGRAGMLMYATQLGSSLQGQYARGWLNAKAASWPGGTAAYYACYDLLFSNFPASTTATYSAPTNYWTDARCTLSTSTCGLNFISSRSDWTSNATWVTMRFGNPQVRHGHEDTGDVTIYRKGKWLMLDVPGYASPWTSAELHSVIAYNGVNDKCGSTPVWKGPGQLSTVGGATDLAYENPSGDQYTYSRAEFAAGYQNSGSYGSACGDYLNPQRVERQTIHIKPDYVVIADRNTWRDNTYAKFQVQMQTDTSTPTSSGGVITSVNGTQKLFFTPLLPTSSTVNIVNLNTAGQVFDLYLDAIVPYGNYGGPNCNQASASSSTSNTVATGSQTFTVPSGMSFGPGLPVALTPSQTATSTTSLVLGTGSKTITTQTGLSYPGGQTVEVYETSNASNYMLATVTSYSGSTLVINSTSFNGSGTFTDWTIITTGLSESATVTSYSGTTLVLNVSAVTGAGTYTSWTLFFGACLNMFGGAVSYYRAEVITPTQTTSQSMLNVLQGADSGASATAAVAITSGNYSGAHIKDSTANWVVGFSSVPAGTGLSLPVTYSYTPTTTTRYHFVANLAASAPVCVTDVSSTITVQTCGSGTSMTTSTQGTLAFSDISGTLAQINGGGGPSVSGISLSAPVSISGPVSP